MAANPTDSHDVTVALARLLKKGTAEPLLLDEPSRQKFRAWLGNYVKAQNVAATAKVIAELVFFFHEKERSPSVARAVLEAADQVYADLAARGIDTRVARSALEETGRRFGHFLGKAGPIAAPRVDEKAPAGTIRAGSMAPPAPRASIHARKKGPET